MPSGTQRLTIYRIGQDVISDAVYWLQWTTVVHAVRGFESPDTTERTYFTGSGAPKWTNNVIGLSGGAPYPQVSRDLGVPTPFTALPGTEYGASFSPDGKRVVFFWGAADPSKRGIYIKSIDAEDMTQLVSTPPESGQFDYGPVWSPDGKTIAFMRRTEKDGTWICLISSAGGPERRLIQLMKTGALFANNQHLSWTKDSQRILAPIKENEDEFRRAIHSISVADGSTKRLTEPTHSSYSPVISPDGQSFVFLRNYGSLRTEDKEVLLQRLTTDGNAEGQPISIYKAPSFPSGIAWTPNGTEVVICLTSYYYDLDDSRLFRLPVQPRAKLSPIGGVGCNTVAISPPDVNGQSNLIYGSRSKSVGTLSQAGLRDLTKVSDFSPSSRFDGFPEFSPDGRLVAFVSSRSGKKNVWVSNSDGSQPKRISEAPVTGFVQWSPDGTRILFGSPGAGLVTVPVTGGPLVRIPTDDAAPQEPHWSHGSNSIYYASKYRLLRIHPDGSGSHKVGEYRLEPYVQSSPDGKTLYLARYTTLYSQPADGGPEKELLTDLRLMHLSTSRTALYYVRRGKGLCALPFDGGPERAIGLLAGLDKARSIQAANFAVSPDDSRIIWGIWDSQEFDLELVKGFR